MTETLKICPFCGNHPNDKLAKSECGHQDFFWVRCDFCDAEGPVMTSEESAVEYWNSRIKENKDEGK